MVGPGLKIPARQTSTVVYIRWYLGGGSLAASADMNSQKIPFHINKFECNPKHSTHNFYFTEIKKFNEKFSFLFLFIFFFSENM